MVVWQEPLVEKTARLTGCDRHVILPLILSSVFFLEYMLFRREPHNQCLKPLKICHAVKIQLHFWSKIYGIT